jgi:hypothetical protein
MSDVLSIVETDECRVVRYTTSVYIRINGCDGRSRTPKKRFQKIERFAKRHKCVTVSVNLSAHFQNNFETMTQPQMHKAQGTDGE